MVPQSKKTVITFLIIGALTLVLLIGFSIFVGYNNGTLRLTVIPSNSVVKIDGVERNSGDNTLTVGEHTLEVSRSNYETKTIKITIKSREILEKTISLTADNLGTAVDDFETNPQDAANAEALGGKKIREDAKIIEERNPIVLRLPYITQTYRIESGPSMKNPDDVGAISIYINYDGEQAKQAALEWMKSQGFPPENYEIIYQSGGYGD